MRDTSYAATITTRWGTMHGRGSIGYWVGQRYPPPGIRPPRLPLITSWVIPFDEITHLVAIGVNSRRVSPPRPGSARCASAAARRDGRRQVREGKLVERPDESGGNQQVA